MPARWLLMALPQGELKASPPDMRDQMKYKKLKNFVILNTLDKHG